MFNPSQAVSEGCFIFHFASLPLEIAQSNYHSGNSYILLHRLLGPFMVKEQTVYWRHFLVMFIIVFDWYIKFTPFIYSPDLMTPSTEVIFTDAIVIGLQLSSRGVTILSIIAYFAICYDFWAWFSFRNDAIVCMSCRRLCPVCVSGAISELLVSMVVGCYTKCSPS